MKRKPLFLILLLVTALGLVGQEVRLKDIGHFAGVRDNQLFGYGVVVGLDGTGDTTQNRFTFQTIANYLDRMGITIQPKDFQIRNTAAVAVTATLPPFARVGSKIDITVSSIGSAKSLQGGVLLATTLLGGDGQVYAVGQGAVSTGGFAAGGAGASTTKNHPTVGRIANGGLIENEVAFDFTRQSSFTLILNQDDFTTTSRVAAAIDAAFGEIAQAVDSRTIRIAIPERFQNQKVQMVALLENLTISPDSRARIVINERTGTVVFGENVRISQVALSHGNISISVRTQYQVSQPLPLSEGQTVVTPDTTVDVREEEARVSLFERSATIADLVKTLNTLGATPRDIIAILQAIKTAGALNADIEVI